VNESAGIPANEELVVLLINLGHFVIGPEVWNMRCLRPSRLVANLESE
jgi:hypothetical protein